MTSAALHSQDPALPGLDGLGGHPLIGRLVRVGQRLHELDTDRPWVLDTAVVAMAFVLFCVPDLVPDGPRGLRPRLARLPTLAVLVLQLALVVPLWWRRRAPSAAFAVVVSVVAVQWVAVLWLRADVALLVALFALALHGPLPHLPWACGATAGALGLVVVRLSPTVFFGDALFFLAGTATASVALGLVLRIRRAYVVALRERAVRLEVERDQRAELAAAAERARVAREMHDIVGHNLSVIIGLADGGAYAAAADPGRGREALELIGGTGRQALGEIRRLLGVLRERDDGPDFSPQPGIADLGALCSRIRAAGPRVAYRTAGALHTLDPAAQLTVYRIAQEALTNTLKHAGARTAAELSVTVDGDAVRLSLRDTGPPGGPPGGPPSGPALHAGDGHGIAGMRERAALYGGTVTAGPLAGGGWAVEALLALAPPVPLTESVRLTKPVPVAESVRLDEPAPPAAVGMPAASDMPAASASPAEPTTFEGRTP